MKTCILDWTRQTTNNRSKNQFAFVRSIGNELFVKKLTYAAEDEKKLMKYL
jgi:hypothetical protein